MVTVKKLISILEKLDPKAVVILSADPEGNGFSPASKDYSIGMYGDWEFMTDSDIAEDPSLKPARAKPAIVLWPE